MREKLDRTDAQEWRRNWPLVLVSMIGVTLTTIHVYSQGVFLLALEKEFGWGRAQFSAGPTLYSFICVFTVVIAGWAADRFGPRRVALPGVLAFCIAMGCLALTSGASWQWYVNWIALALTYPLISPTIWSVAVASRFTASRGLAMGATLAGTGVGALVTPMLANYLIVQFGWRIAYAMMPLIWLLVLLPLGLFLFFGAHDRPAGRGAQGAATRAALPGVNLREGYLSSYFWRLAFSCFLFIFGLLGMMVHFVPIVTNGGLDLTSAAMVAGIIGIASIIGRFSTGALLDRFHGRYVGFFAFLAPLGAVAILLNYDGTLWMAGAAAFVIGASLGAEFDVIAYLLTRYLGLRHYGAYFGLVMGLSNLATGAGIFFAGLIFDKTQAYTVLFWSVIPLFIIGALIVGSLGQYPNFSQTKNARE